MKTTVNFSQFHDAFKAIRPDNFSSDGLRLLFDYIQQLEEDIDEEIELDVIALCCDYAEENADEIANNYDIDISDCETDEEKVDRVREYIDENGYGFAGLTSENTIVYFQF
jgi:predicted ArsR family transcriptional regulator